MREVELKSVLDDWDARLKRTRAAGAREIFTGRLADTRFDTPDRSLTARDEVLRLRVRRNERESQAQLDWKGPTTYEANYKVREEISLELSDADAATEMLTRLGYDVTHEIDRHVAVWELDGATIRFERYPRMDDLVEVEGEPDAIEKAIALLGLPRGGFTPERLLDFVRRFQQRTGTRAAVCDRELQGDYTFALESA